MKSRNSFHIDLHVHTARHSECAESLDPLLLEQFATEAKINGVVVTEHDTLWNKNDFIDLKNQCSGILLFNGIEVTTKNGYHLVILGIEENGILRKGIGCDEVISYAHGNNAIVILAHPFRNGLPPMKTMKLLDAIEIGSTSLYKREANLSRCLAESLEKPGIASSDAHALTMVGWAYTSFPEKPENIHHLCTMIKEGSGIPVLPHSFFA